MKNLTILISAALAAFGVPAALAEPAAKVVYDANTRILTFYYDENTYEGDGITQFKMNTGNNPGWVDDASAKMATNAVFTSGFSAYQPTCVYRWFYSLIYLKRIDGLTNVDTSKITSMRRMFQGSNKLQELDLSSFDTSNVSDTREMFSGCSSLTTIYVSDRWTNEKMTNDDNMFKSCTTKLVGGAGTVWNSEKISHVYACIDDPDNGKPGYLTEKKMAVPPTIETVGYTDLTHESVTVEVDGLDLQDGSITIELVATGSSVDPKILAAFGKAEFSGLVPETTYTIKVTAQNGNGSVVDESCSFTTLAKPADDWTYSVDEDTGLGSVTWGGWTFDATVAEGTHDLSIGACTVWPTVISPLDFERKVVDKDANEYTVVSLSPAFSYLKSGDLTGKEQGGFVGNLTLPPAVTNIGAYAFGYCTNATGVVNLPSTLTTLGDYAFAKSGLTFRGADFASLEKVPAYCFKDTKVSGEANLANATSVTKGAFENVSSLRSVKFGPKLTSLYGDYNHGAFHGCSSLTNVTFDADSCFRISGDNVFAACAALKKIDLCGVTSMTVSRTGDYKGSHFKGCGNLAEIDLGPALTNLARSAISIDAQNPKKIVFEGKVPDVFGTPYLFGCQTNNVIKTYIHSYMRAKKNAAGKCWRDYAANRQILPANKDSSKNTTFAAEYIQVDADGTAAKRPLLSLEPIPGFLLLIR